jgi:NTP pyrophosphatase (non-canonical NTP hydrolase)
MKDRLFAHLNLRGEELAMYERVYAALSERIPVPDLVVYLRASTDTLMERIAVRDRPYERDMDREYIEALNRAYEGFFTAYRDSPVITVDTDELNFVARREDLDYVVGQVRAAIGFEAWQEPLPELDLAATLDLAQKERRLVAFQRFHEVLDAEKGFLSDVYLNFICLQEEMGGLAAELKSLWVETARGQANERQIIAQKLDRLRSELADCLAYLLKLSNGLGIDLEEAYLEKITSTREQG